MAWSRSRDVAGSIVTNGTSVRSVAGRAGRAADSSASSCAAAGNSPGSRNSLRSTEKSICGAHTLLIGTAHYYQHRRRWPRTWRGHRDKPSDHARLAATFRPAFVRPDAARGALPAAAFRTAAPVATLATLATLVRDVFAVGVAFATLVALATLVVLAARPRVPADVLVADRLAALAGARVLAALAALDAAPVALAAVLVAPARVAVALAAVLV